jgi:hypothetical protein
MQGSMRAKVIFKAILLQIYIYIYISSNYFSLSNSANRKKKDERNGTKENT